MASVNEPCCGHDHVGGDELWLSVDEIIDLIRFTVQEMFASPEGRLPADQRQAIRERYEERRREQSAPPPPPPPTRRQRMQRAVYGIEPGESHR